MVLGWLQYSGTFRARGGTPNPAMEPVRPRAAGRPRVGCPLLWRFLLLALLWWSGARCQGDNATEAAAPASCESPDYAAAPDAPTLNFCGSTTNRHVCKQVSLSGMPSRTCARIQTRSRDRAIARSLTPTPSRSRMSHALTRTHTHTHTHTQVRPPGRRGAQRALHTGVPVGGQLLVHQTSLLVRCGQLHSQVRRSVLPRARMRQ